MSRVFISYAHEDVEAAQRIVGALQAEGIEAWWDHQIPPGRSWDEVIGARIAAASVVLVIWSRRSIASNFVKEEAQLAHDAGKFLPVRIDDVEPPVGFRRVHAANFVGWRGDASHGQWQVALGEIRERLNLAPAAPVSSVRRTPKSAKPRSSAMPLLLGLFVLLAIGGGAVYMLRAQLGLTATASVSPAPTPPDQTMLSPGTTPTVTAEPSPVAPVSASAQSSPTVDPRTVEMQYWRSCCDRADASAEDYRSYLALYPRGDFARIARARTTPAAASPAPASTPAPAAPAAITSVVNTVWSGTVTLNLEGRCSGVPGTFQLYSWEFRSDGTIPQMSGLCGKGSWSERETAVEFSCVTVIQGYPTMYTQLRGVRSGNTISGTLQMTRETEPCMGGSFSLTRLIK